MRVQIDEARRHNQATRIDHNAARQRILSNRPNCIAGYPYVTDGIKIGLRVDNPSALQNNIVLLGNEVGEQGEQT